MEKIYFIYVDYRLDDGRPFYVGKGQLSRTKDFERNSLHENIAKKHGIKREIILASKDEGFVFDEEIRRIAELRTYVGFGEGGANLTKGGEGATGVILSEEARKKISASSKRQWENPEVREAMIEAILIANNIEDRRELLREKMTSRWANPDARSKMLEGMHRMSKDPELGKLRSENAKLQWERYTSEEKKEITKKISETQKRTYELHPELKAQRIESAKESQSRPETKAKKSEAMKKCWSDDESRKKLGDAIRDGLSTPEAKKKMSEGNKRVWADPAYREKMSNLRKGKNRGPRSPETIEKIRQKALERAAKKREEKLSAETFEEGHS